MKDSYEFFARKATERGLSPKQCTPIHWQVRGERLVNYYPTTGRVYVDGAECALNKHHGLYHALDLAQGSRTIVRVDESKIPGIIEEGDPF